MRGHGGLVQHGVVALFGFGRREVADGSRNLPLLNQSTHSRVANSTASNFRHGLRRWITSALERPLKVSARALSWLPYHAPAVVFEPRSYNKFRATGIRGAEPRLKRHGLRQSTTGIPSFPSPKGLAEPFGPERLPDSLLSSRFEIGGVHWRVHPKRCDKKRYVYQVNSEKFGSAPGHHASPFGLRVAPPRSSPKGEACPA